MRIAEVRGLMRRKEREEREEAEVPFCRLEGSVRAGRTSLESMSAGLHAHLCDIEWVGVQSSASFPTASSMSSLW